MRILPFFLLLFFSCDNSRQSESYATINTPSRGTEKPNEINYNLTREELFLFLNNQKTKLSEFRNGLVEESVYLTEPWGNINDLSILPNTDVGVFVFKYNRYQEYVKNEASKRTSTMLAQIYVSRQKSELKWDIEDSTILILAIIVHSANITIDSIPRIGIKKSVLLEQLGNADIDQDSILTYSEIKKGYKLNIDFHFSNDTLMKLEFNRLKL